LPALPERATVLAGAEAWRDPLTEAGVDLESGDPQLVVTDPATVGEAAVTGAPAVIVEGRGRPPAGYRSRRFLPLPSPEDASLLVPLDRGNVAAYALDTWLFPSTWARAVRKKALVTLARPALALLPRPTVTVATREPGRPLFVDAAVERFGLDPEPDWFVVCGQGDELSRGLFVLFPRGARRPSWAVKFARVPGYAEPFERDEAGLGLVAAAGGAAAEHAPRLLGRFQAAGHEASVEAAAVGSRLAGVLQARGSRRDKLRAVEAVADWLLAVARETRGGPGSAAPEAERLRREVLPAWPAVDPDVLTGVETLPGVLQHNDLGGWNVVLDRSGGFTAVDWESARKHGLPFWDLWYFLAHVLVQVDRPGGDPVAAFAELFRGELHSSPLLFGWTRAAAEALELPAEVVGRLATLCWLHHGLSHSARAETLARHAPTAAPQTWAAARFPEAWLADPALGLAWSRWREG
jgi:hypothetical protein